MPNTIPLLNIINVSVSETPTGVNVLNTSNVALFSTDQPNASLPAAGFGFYVQPSQVQTDWGSSSITAQMAEAIFSQQPNILTPDGQLIIIEMLTATQLWTPSGVPASGSVIANYNGNASAAIDFGDTAAQIQGKLQAVPGLAGVIVTGTLATTVSIKLWGVYGATPAVMTFTSNTLETAGSAPVTIAATISTNGESLTTAITRTQGLVNYFGVLETATYETIGSTDFAAAATLIQANPLMYFEVSARTADVTGEFTANTTAKNTQTRCLYYGDLSAAGPVNEMLMKAAYVGRLLSVDFTASNTTLNAQLKQLTGVAPDPSMTQTIYNECLAAGVDCYPSFQGYSGISSSGANEFFDAVYNQLSFASALQVAGFNYLAGTTTKILQTEAGMDGLKGAYRAVCNQYVTNAYLAPGAWNSSTTFGNPTDLISNVSQFGFYIYSQPVALQSEAQRMTRQAPLVSIAGKEAGGINSSNVVVYINP
jgi:hypothetical protein